MKTFSDIEQVIFGAVDDAIVATYALQQIDEITRDVIRAAYEKGHHQGTTDERMKHGNGS